MNRQSWITRWDKSRMQVEGNVILRVLRVIVPYSITASIILSLSLGVVKYRDVTAISGYNENLKSGNGNLEKNSTNEQRQTILDSLKDRRSKYYIVEKDDTLLEIALRHNRTLSTVVKANKKIVQDPNYIYPGQSLFIPALKSESISVSKTKNQRVKRINGTSSLTSFSSTSSPSTSSSTPLTTIFPTIISPPISD